MSNEKHLANVNYYVNKCQILVDYYLGDPPHIDATQEMVDELVADGFLDENGLTAEGKKVAKIVELCFSLSKTLENLLLKSVPRNL